MNLVKYFENRVYQNPQKPFLVEEIGGEVKRELTYQKTWDGLCNVANNLGQSHLRPQERVAVILPNSPELIMVWFGVNAVGAVACMLEPI